MNGTHPSTLLFRVCLLSAAVGLALLPRGVSAQTMDHSKMQMPAPQPAPAKPPVRKRAAEKPAAKPTPTRPRAEQGVAVKPPPRPEPVMDHSAMEQDPVPAPEAAPVDHSAMDMDAPTPVDDTQAESESGAEPSMEGMDHAAMGKDMGAMPSEPVQAMDHSGMPGMAGMSAAPTEPVTPIPELTDSDRAAAVPPPGGHAVHDNSIQSFVLIDQLEVWNADEGTGTGWNALGWVGTDLDRLWVRSEGERVGGVTEIGDVEVLYGRSISRWWDLVAGVRQDFGEGPPHTFAALGVIGLAPYKFEVEATAYIGEGGQTGARVEVEYDTLLTNRLILQWRAEADAYGRNDPSRGVGSGLNTTGLGLRLRYEIRREFAPYIGVVRERAYGNTADFRRERFDDIEDTRIVAGVRIWF